MRDRYFTAPVFLEHLRQGALGTAVDNFAADLHEHGYARGTAKSYVAIAGHFSQWLTLEGIAPIDLSTETLERFRKEHLPVCRCPRPRGRPRHVRAALGHVLAGLRCLQEPSSRNLRFRATDRLLDFLDGL